VDVVWHQVAFQDLRLLLIDKGVKDLPQIAPQVSVKASLSTLRNENNVIFALPLTVI
jgi:hypothetical protein